MIAMIEITTEVAQKLFDDNGGSITLYGLDRRDGTEWELETEADFNNIADHADYHFGIEGRLFGQPYNEAM